MDMNNKVLTIAIPVYNMERYLNRCLDSIIESNSIDDLEILVINDGSKDKSLQIAKDYEIRHKDSFRVIDKQNGGWGSAINIAMKEATGKYFKILDSDDWFNSVELSKMIEELRHIDVDVFATSYSTIYDNEPAKVNLFDKKLCEKNFSLDELIPQIGYECHTPMATICIRTEILKKMHLQISDKFYADIEFGLIPFSQVKTIKYSQLNVYQYYLGREDHSTSIVGYINHYIDYVLMTKKLVSSVNELEMTDNYRKLMIKEVGKFAAFAYYILLSPAFKGEDSESKIILKELDAFYKTNSLVIYKEIEKKKIKRLPYIKIWRLTGINILNLRKWI